MKIVETGFDGLIIIKPAVFRDNRGYFLESFNLSSIRNAGISFNPVQDNESKSTYGVVRGLHYQLQPYAQSKLIRVVDGRIFDVALDLRENSKTFGKWFGTELDSENKDQLLVPAGFAHGFSVLSETAVIQYKCDNYYNREFERGIALNDPSLAIDWKLGALAPVLSEKDSKHPPFRDAEMNFR